MWISREKHPIPDKEGIFVVARFIYNALDNVWTDQLINFSTDYIYLKSMGGWRPNKIGGIEIEFTHYMSYNDYKIALSNIPKE